MDDLEAAVDVMRRHHWEEDSDWYVSHSSGSPRVMRGDMAQDYSPEEAIAIARRLEPTDAPSGLDRATIASDAIQQAESPDPS